MIMKTLHTIYTSFAKRVVMLLIVLMTISVGTSIAQDELVYTLTPASGDNNSYAGNCDITISGITWNLTGNSTTQPWRIGGKSLNKADRTLYSKTAITDDISKIVITHGTSSSGITVNSMKVIVSTAQNGGGTVISTLTPTFKANGDVTITRPDGKNWSKAFYKIVYNVTVSSSNNYLQFSSAKFYKTTAPSTFTVTCRSSNSDYGTVSRPSVTDVANNTVISANGNTLTVGTTIVTATPKEQDENYSYSFTNWTGIPSGNIVTANCTITANFTCTPRALTNYRTTCTEPSTFNITYNTNGGSPIAATSGTTLPDPLPPTTKTGYTFAGWYTDEECTQEATAGAEITQNTTLHAKWTANTYTVCFNANGGTGTMGDQSFTYGAEQALSSNKFTRDSYIFAGWAITADGDVVYTDAQSVSNLTTTNGATITLYAQWTEVYTINFYSNGTQYGSSQEIEASEIVTLPMTDPTSCDANYSHFFGWTEILIDGVSNTQPTDLIQEDFTPTRSMNLHAVFVDELPQLGGWELVTSDEGLIEGDIYTISSTNSTSSGYVFGQQKENNRAAVSWTTGTPVELTLGGSIGEWTLYDAAYDNGVGGYLYAASSNKNYLRTMLEITDNAKWHISFSNQKVTITAQGSNTHNTIRYNNSDINNLLFSCYDQDAGNVYLFKRAVGTTPNGYITNCCTPWAAPTLSANTSIAVGGTTTITHSGTAYGVVTYSSSDETIATVDENGKVAGVKPGKATITATWDGVDGINNYCPAEATIDVTVTGSFTITYDANHASATGATTATTIAYPTGQGTVAANGFALNGHEFVKWNTTEDGSGTSYNAGDAITLTDDTTLYAIWQPNQYDITVNVVGGSITLGTTTITTANTPQTITDVVAHGQSFSFTNATPDAAYETPYTVTRISGTATVTSNSLTISDVQSDLEITIEYTLKPVYTITYIIPEGGGELTADAVTSIYKDGSITLPDIKDGTISSEYSCEEFIGWTTLNSYESYEGAMPTPFYNAGDELSDITEATTLRPVYKRNGAGEGGTIAIEEEDMKSWNPNSSSSIAYGQTRSFTKGNFTWETTAMQQSSWGGEVQLDKYEENYIKLPDLPGDLQSVTLDCRNGGSNTLTDGTFYLKDKNNAVIKQSSVSPNNVCTFTDIPAGNSTAYLYAGVVSRILGITITYGSPSIISTNLSCDYNVDEFTITYHTNFGTGVGQIPTGTVVNGACDNSVEPIRFEDLPNGEYTICNSLTATQYKLVGWNNQPDGNGGLTYRPGDVITAVSQSVITLYAQWVPEVIMLDNKDRTITYQETVGETITLPSGAYTCDGKYTFVGWTTDNVDSWNQKITKPTLVAELDGNDETLFVPTEPTVVYAVYKLETTANSKAFYLKSGNYYAQKHNTYVLTGTDNIANATRLYRQQINVESPNNYWLYYLDDEQQKRFVYINTANLGSLFIPSIGDGETTPEDTEGWEFVSVTGGYKLKALGNYSGSTQYMRTSDSGNMGSNTTGSVYTIETATEINYYAYPTCSDEITITFETRGGTLIPNDHPYVLTKKEGDVITLPGCEYAGLDFIGWVNEPIEPTEIIANPEDIYEAGEEYVVGDQNIVLYAYYSQTPESAEYDGNSDGEWKIYAFANGEYHFAVAPDSEEGEMSTVTICDKSTTWTFTNVAENQYYIQDEAGRYVGVRPAIENENDFQFTDEPVIWTIESKGNDLYRLTCETNIDRVMLYDNGRIRYSSHTQEEKPGYFYVTIGGCFNPIYTTDPARLQAVSVYGTVQITSTLGQTVKAMDKLTLVVRHAEPESYIRFSSPNVTFYDESGNVITTALVESQKQQIPLVVAYTPDVADNSITRPAITVTAKTLNPSTGTYVETNYSVNGRISARSLPATFAIVAKVGNLWYALPSQGLNSTDALIGYPVEVDNQNDPTAVTAVPENADWSLRQVYAASHSDAQKDRFKLNGANIMFENNASPAKMLNASVSDNYLLTNAEYDNYKQSDNQGLYEWTPTTTDLETYQLTNEQRGRTLSVNIATVFGVHAQNVATNNLRFLPITGRYTPAALQVVEWKENSVVIMYNGDPAQTASVSVNGGEAQPTTLSDAQRDIAVYELTATGLAANPTQRLSITIGTEKLLLPIPYIVNSNTTDATLTSNNKTLAAVSDLVVLNGKTFTADAATASKYTFRNVTIYGGGKLVIPSDKGFGVASLTLRAGGITDAGKYDYVYPQFELRGTFTNSAAKINYDYITDYDHWFHLVLPFSGDLGTIKYPTEFYGANVATNNTGSWQIKRYAGEIRATGNYNAWVDIETESKTSTTAGQGYIFWGAPKKVSVNGGASTRQKWGIQRITMSVTAPNAMTAENGDKAISELSSYENVPNNSRKDNDQGWNLIGNPYMVNLTDMATTGLHACKLVEVIDPATGKWNGKWEWNDETNIRYLTIPSDHFDTYTAKTVAQTVPLVAGRAFFVQLDGEANGITFAAANRASLMPALLAENNDKPVDIETGIILSNETLQDEVNFWIKDGKTNDYEYNADYPKTPNNNHFNIYGVHTNGDLSWVATSPEYAAESMPIGYQVPVAGTFTLSVSETYYSENLQALFVTDHEASPEVTTNLVDEDYTFYVNQAETNNTRFTVSIILKPDTENTPTGVDNIDTKGKQPIKFLYQDKIYILRNGMIYDTTGKQVITINK